MKPHTDQEIITQILEKYGGLIACREDLVMLIKEVSTLVRHSEREKVLNKIQELRKYSLQRINWGKDPLQDDYVFDRLKEELKNRVDKQ